MNHGLGHQRSFLRGAAVGAWPKGIIQEARPGCVPSPNSAGRTDECGVNRRAPCKDPWTPLVPGQDNASAQEALVPTPALTASQPASQVPPSCQQRHRTRGPWRCLATVEWAQWDLPDKSAAGSELKRLVIWGDRGPGRAGLGGQGASTCRR